MTVYSFYIFDRHTECIYSRRWAQRPISANINAAQRQSGTSAISNGDVPGVSGKALSNEDDAKLIFGTIFSLRRMVRQLGGEDDSFLSYRTGEYKLHYFETATNLKFVMLTDTRIANMRTVLYQIWANLYVEYVVKSPISPVEHPGGVGVANELFEGALESFILPSQLVSLFVECLDCGTRDNASFQNGHSHSIVQLGPLLHRVPEKVLAPLISSWRFVRVSQDRKWLHCASHLRKSDREPPPHELTRKLDLNTISSVDSSISKCRVPADWEMQRPVSEKDTANQQNQAAKAITKLTIYGSKAGSPTLRAGDEEEETILLELNTASSSLASEWLDGLLMLLNQQPITADTNKLMDVLESWTVNARMLNLQWEDVDWVQAVLDDYRNSYSGQFSLSSHCSDIACTSERTAYYPHKHGHPRRIKNFSLPSSYTTDADRASLRTASWPPDDILYQEDLGSSTSPTRFYHDPDARAKLRQYIATPQDFDEALAERETTFRMTLTRPGLRSMNELRRWQQQDSSRSESNPDEDSDPLALEPLPFSDDTNGAQGHFAASDPEGKGIRKVWKLLNRRSSAASRSS
ncbi:hypothetical protein MBLNU459_g5429t1 [Dothideomycetes sp. NU459]